MYDHATGGPAASGAAGPVGLRALRRMLAWHRRWVAAALAGAAVLALVGALRPAPPPGQTVLAAARDIPGGVVLRPADLRPVALPAEAVPAGALRPGAQVAGRLLAGPMRRGEPLTDVRLLGPELLAGYREDGRALVATPIRVADPGVARLLAPGDRVAVFAADARTSGDPVARMVAAGARVLAVPRAYDPGSPSDPPAGDPAAAEGALVVLATTPELAQELARAAVTSRLSVAVLGR
ncbi:SAF domain protein [Carbonactinospora thermoautotrophica]|uniref:SAF domain protein n=2 Tax=Carbonactinospora thermoautotrophica TaxID=1469144 RepID=A0A132MMA6_9ACTN|nr:Flp pilus assembly protein CpaB [Carbonactinospora thermoautotrophica]KWW98992.1 SAF domain protein [Carbonactinospora thermoautotrophica]